MTCIFCDIIAGKVFDHVIAQDDDVVVILSLEGHPLVLSRHHVPSLDDLEDLTAAALMQTATRVARGLRKATGCEGVNLVLSDVAAAG